MKVAIVAALVLLASCATAPKSAPDVSAGYASIRIQDANARPIQLDIWYPAAGPEQPHSYNFGSGKVAVAAPIEPGKHPIIILSHGSMGAASNYSWIAEPLARHGYVVLGVSHFGESPVFGQETIKPANVSHFGDRTRDINAGLEFLFTKSAYAAQVDPARLGALGHSAGGATVLMLAGAQFVGPDLFAYCGPARATGDKGCLYPVDPAASSPAQAPVSSSRPISAFVVIDPAAGPGFSEGSLHSLRTPAMVIGSADDDFLPFPAHAGRIASMLGSAELVKLDGGEGHFVYVDRCSLPINVMGVQLCSDRPGVDRDAVHAKLVPLIEAFFDKALAK